MHKEINLGIAPIGKFIFSHDAAMEQKKKIYSLMDNWKIKYHGIDEIIDDGMVRGDEDIDPVVNYLKSKKIDAVFIPHCNFGTESAASMIAKRLSVPVLLWGPRDQSPLPDGTRMRDSLCGMLATSKVLHKLDVIFTYIENCEIENPAFEKGFKRFIKAARVKKNVSSLKIGQIGTRIDFFWSTIIDESDLLNRFGIQILPFDMADFINSVNKRQKKHQNIYKAEVKELSKTIITRDNDYDENLMGSLALRDELISRAVENDLNAIAIKTFPSLQKGLKAITGLGCALACDRGIPILSESDIHGAISSVMLESATDSGNSSFSADIVMRHPEDDNGILLWHGIAPLSQKDPDSSINLYPTWTFKDLPPINASFKLKDGTVTICRFDGDKGNYCLGIGEGNTIQGPYNREFYAWVKVNDWKGWEKKIIYGPYIHHFSAIFDKCSDVLIEACRYLPEIKADEFE